MLKKLTAIEKAPQLVRAGAALLALVLLQFMQRRAPLPGPVYALILFGGSYVFGIYHLLARYGQERVHAVRAAIDISLISLALYYLPSLSPLLSLCYLAVILQTSTHLIGWGGLYAASLATITQALAIYLGKAYITYTRLAFVSVTLFLVALAMDTLAHRRAEREESWKQLFQDLEAVLNHRAALLADLEDAHKQLQEYTAAVEEFNLELEKRNETLALISEVFKAAGSSLEMGETLPLILNKAVKLLGAAGGFVMLLDEERGDLHFGAARNLSEETTKNRVKIGEGIAGRVVMTGQPLLQQGEGGSLSLISGLAGGDRIESVICVPLEAESKIIGVIGVFNKLFEAFTEEDLALLSVVGSQAGSIIENSLLYTRLKGVSRELKQRVEELSTMQEIARELNASLDLDRVLNLVLERAIQLTSAQAGVIALLDKGRGGLFIAAMQGLPPHTEVYRFQPWPLERGIVGRVARTGQPSLVADVSQDPDYVVVLPQTRSQLTVPLLAKGQAIGVIALESSELVGFDEEDLRYLSSLADQAAIAINNAQLHSRAEELATAEERDRIAREMHDGLAQDLAALFLRVQRSLKLIDTDPVTAKMELIKIGTVLQQDTQELRRLILALRPLDLEELGFSSALHRLIREFEADNVLTIHLSGVEDAPCLSRELEFVLFRVVQESLNNVRKHAQANNVWIDLALHAPGAVSLTIRDDGRGFDSGEAVIEGLSRGRLGLLHMQERVEAIGGTLAIETAPTSGTRVAVTLPINDPGRNSR